jgi:RecA/RadA recombinase
LRAAAARAAPPVLARDRLLQIDGSLGDVLPAGGIRRGATVALDGPPGAGSTTIACTLAAATTSAGEWAAVVDPDGTFGARAAAGAGVALERCAFVRGVSPEQWATVVAALLDGVTLVIADTPPALRAGDARRLTARARERASVLVALGEWPAEASLRVYARGGEWRLDGLLAPRSIDIEVAAKERHDPHRVRLVS